MARWRLRRHPLRGGRKKHFWVLQSSPHQLTSGGRRGGRQTCSGTRAKRERKNTERREPLYDWAPDRVV